MGMIGEELLSFNVTAKLEKVGQGLLGGSVCR